MKNHGKKTSCIFMVIRSLLVHKSQLAGLFKVSYILIEAQQFLRLFLIKKLNTVFLPTTLLTHELSTLTFFPAQAASCSIK